MNSKDQAKRLKAFAKKREARVSPAVSPAASDREKERVACLGAVTASILELRRQDSKLRDSSVIEALRYEVREPGVRLSSDNPVHRVIESVKSQNAYDVQVWRSAIKALLAMSDPMHTPHRNPTQLLDLMETVAR